MDESKRNDEDERTGGSGRDVISSLPRHRPHRRSAKRGATRAAATSAKAAEKAEANGTAATPKKPRAAAKPKPRAATTATPKPAPKKAPPRTPREKIGATAQKPRVTPANDKPDGPPSGTELIGTAVQAAGELATIGLKLGTQAVKNAVGRLPRP